MKNHVPAHVGGAFVQFCRSARRLAATLRLPLSQMLRRARFPPASATQAHKPRRSVVGSTTAAGKNEDVGKSPWKAITVLANVDERHRLEAEVPQDVPLGQVQVIVLLPDASDEDEAGDRWAEAVASEWNDELEDSRQDLYTLEDGQPVNAPR